MVPLHPPPGVKNPLLERVFPVGLTRVELVTSPLSGLRRGFGVVRVGAETRLASAMSSVAIQTAVPQMAHRMAS